MFAVQWRKDLRECIGIITNIWCMQNTCMIFEVYWCIFQNNKMSLVVIIMFHSDLWGFSINSPYFGYNSARQKTMFYVFLSFRDLPELKLTQDFWSINILPWQAPTAQEVNEGGHEAQKRQMAWPLTRPCHPVSFEARTSDAIHLHLLTLSFT
jgi:hypothetical protein